MPTVMKFGGSSLGNASSILQVAQIVANHLTRHDSLHVVVSAMAGITNKLEALLSEPYLPTQITQAHAILGQHNQCARELQLLLPRLDLTNLTFAIKTEGLKLLDTLEHNHEHEQDAQVLTTGERLSATILTSTLQALGIAAERLAAATLIAVNKAENSYAPNLELTQQQYLKLMQGVPPPVLVTEGFYGCTEDGKIGCFGRNGSDLSAAVLAIAAKAQNLTIWSDVAGVFAADPRLVANSHIIKSLSLAKLYSFAHLGATVIYAPTLSYLAQHQLSFTLKNTFAPSEPGTVVSVEDLNPTSFWGVAAIEKIQVELNGNFCVISGNEKSKVSHRYLFALTRAECSNHLVDLASVALVESQPELSLLTCVSDNINQLAPKLEASLQQAGITMYQMIQNVINNAVSFIVPRSSLACGANLLYLVLTQNHRGLMQHDAPQGKSQQEGGMYMSVHEHFEETFNTTECVLLSPNIKT